MEKLEIFSALKAIKVKTHEMAVLRDLDALIDALETDLSASEPSPTE